MSSPLFGDYIYWDKIKIKLDNHPNIKIIDFETGLTWMVTVVNKDVINSLHADVEPSSILDKLKSSNLWGGDSWEPRPVLVEMPDGSLVAASIHNMPHAGLMMLHFYLWLRIELGGMEQVITEIL